MWWHTYYIVACHIYCIAVCCRICCICIVVCCLSYYFIVVCCRAGLRLRWYIYWTVVCCKVNDVRSSSRSGSGPRVTIGIGVRQDRFSFFFFVLCSKDIFSMELIVFIPMRSSFSRSCSVVNLFPRVTLSCIHWLKLSSRSECSPSTLAFNSPGFTEFTKFWKKNFICVRDQICFIFSHRCWGNNFFKSWYISFASDGALFARTGVLLFLRWLVVIGSAARPEKRSKTEKLRIISELLFWPMISL